jgi:DNA-binding CsgD family transcriptional regulator
LQGRQVKLLERLESSDPNTALMELWFQSGRRARLIVSETLLLIAWNDLADQIIRGGDALTQRNGVLVAVSRERQDDLTRLIGSPGEAPAVFASIADGSPLVATSERLGSEGLFGLEMWRADPSVRPALPNLSAVYGLTRSESALIPGVVQGLSNDEIARELAVSVETVRTHLKNACAKLCVSGRGAFAAKINAFVR